MCVCPYKTPDHPISVTYHYICHRLEISIVGNVELRRKTGGMEFLVAVIQRHPLLPSLLRIS